MMDYEKLDLKDAIKECERLSDLFPSWLILEHAIDIDEVSDNDWAFEKTQKIQHWLCQIETEAKKLVEILKEIEAAYEAKEKDDE